MKHPFETEYGDHFETPFEAFRDLSPALPPSARLFDPYYCEGACVKHLHRLGFKNVINENEDFYASKRFRGHVDDFDIVVTNPPYSGDHKARIFQFCLESKKKWALLVPAYVVDKSYFPRQVDCFFIVPKIKYEYHHPEGTGKDTSPFESLWIVHLGADTDRVYRQLSPALTHATLKRTRDDLVSAKTLRGTKRPNPRQRKREKRRRTGG